MDFLSVLTAIANWLSQNIKPVTDCIAYIIAAASILVNLTPSSKDNAVLDAIKKILGFIALNPPVPTESKDEE
ncbi:MAG TPA: hypothetical protein VIL29_04970 [Pseudothermotoga sp.]|jgi:hypothetical protein